MGLGLHKECVWENISWEGTGLFLEFAVWFFNVAVQQKGTVGKGIGDKIDFFWKMLFTALIWVRLGWLCSQGLFLLQSLRQWATTCSEFYILCIMAG